MSKLIEKARPSLQADRVDEKNGAEILEAGRKLDTEVAKQQGYEQNSRGSERDAGKADTAETGAQCDNQEECRNRLADKLLNSFHGFSVSPVDAVTCRALLR